MSSTQDLVCFVVPFVWENKYTHTHNNIWKSLPILIKPTSTQFINANKPWHKQKETLPIKVICMCIYDHFDHLNIILHHVKRDSARNGRRMRYIFCSFFLMRTAHTTHTSSIARSPRVLNWYFNGFIARFSLHRILIELIECIANVAGRQTWCVSKTTRHNPFVPCHTTWTCSSGHCSTVMVR